ncbi:serine--tRNA ligase [Gordonia desulfuricans]|uniref:Serine--tRNA ligase n=1 Tax=Gordonia desulfuricans TaxID=89051 RepID=A0A7K3LVS6_9ACTN|nr:serine--tRNA ligase [Gordonia desulfuricans]NDK92051.1 serine--tRNA ligase [Gordonia desulfuricans]
MIDLKILRDDPERVRVSQRARGEDPGLVDALLAADAIRRSAIVEADSLRSEQKSLGKQVGKASGDEKTALLARGKELAEQVKAAVAKQAEADEQAKAAHLAISNIIESAPAGGEDDYVVLEHVGEPRALDNPKDHLELGESLGLLDMERGAKVSGSRFYFLTGQGALLQLGLLNMAAAKAVASGFSLMIPPVLVRPEVMGGTGFLGAHADEVYHLDKDDDLYLVGTSEVPLAGYHMNEILDLSDGPKRYAGWSTCFRREAGSYGKDTRGIIRVHQFDKIEGFIYCRPEEAEAEHQKLLNWEKDMLGAIEVPYRVIDVAGGDLGSSAARKFDCEAWVPTQNTYRELTSTSNCTTFQARRLSIRYRDEQGKPQVAATLNGTLATTRWIVAILENHQQPDGTVRLPAELAKFVGTDVLAPA